MLIKRTDSLTAYPEPLLEAGRIPNQVWEDWKDRSLTMKDWTMKFQAVNCEGANMTTAEDVK